MRKIDRAVVRRMLGGEFPNGPRASWTLLNEAEGRVYFLGWKSLYQNFTYPLRDAGNYPAAGSDAGNNALAQWQDSVERVRRGELEAGLILQVPQDEDADVPLLDRVLDGVFFGEIVENGDELVFRAEDRCALKYARAPRQESA